MSYVNIQFSIISDAKSCQIYFGISVPFSSLSLFAPSIVAGLGYKDLEAQLMTVPPYAAAYVVTLLVSWSADHFNAWVHRLDGLCSPTLTFDLVVRFTPQYSLS